MKNKIKGKAEELKGKVTGNKTEEVKGKARQKVGDAQVHVDAVRQELRDSNRKA